SDLAAAGLPDLPTTRQGVELLAKRLDWRAHPELARRRTGRGGGWEYNWRLLPARAQAMLLKPAAPEEVAQPARMDRGHAWAWFEDQPEKTREAARYRLGVIQQVEALEPAMGRNGAVDAMARASGVSARTLWNWLGMIEGVETADRLPYLAPRHRATAPKRDRAVASTEFFDRLRSE